MAIMLLIMAERDIPGKNPFDLNNPCFGYREELDALGLQKIETATEYANEWTGWLRDDIRRINATETVKGIKVDREKATRGQIVGDITGDAVNPLWGSLTIVQVCIDNPSDVRIKDRWFIRTGAPATYLAVAKSIFEFGHNLPEGVLTTYKGLLHEHKSFIEQVGTGRLTDFQEIYDTGCRLFRAIKDTRKAPGMQPLDIEYSLYVHNPEVFYTELFEK